VGKRQGCKKTQGKSQSQENIRVGGTWKILEVERVSLINVIAKRNPFYLENDRFTHAILFITSICKFSQHIPMIVKIV
jgi:hypothetical protein